MASGLPKPVRYSAGLCEVESSSNTTQLFICELSISIDGHLNFGTRNKYDLAANARINGTFTYSLV